ncbi:MAG: protein-disulfide reductase DsbD N-terminal domain-containing protein [Odoribacteraceae bacterium]|jgi:hypothetical protein|nr:protein-disulfide reductase DsbD N-terminal domain-containing protein [Odoribacteraceae bacterium]
MKQILQLLAIATLLALPCGTFAQKSDLRVLYVSGSADWDVAHFKGDTALLNASVRERAASFEAMLKTYFNTVTVVRAADYAQRLSLAHDVTVMDGTPAAILPSSREYDASGALVKIRATAYFTEDFDRPVVTIGELGEKLGRRIGLKTDWYCLCLDADAHHLRADHPIFSTPFPVRLTTRVKATPEAATHYAYYADGALPDSIPMWQVQTKGYITDPGFRVGMVARPWGFEDSPDAEYISSGVCAKTLDAVAIGRHGNFLHWGFAASPTYMTTEAQTVLANAIVYISRFAGQGVIARKYEDRIATREYLKELKYLSTRESYDERLVSEEVFHAQILEVQKIAKEKQAKGEYLSTVEQQMINYKKAPTMTFEEYVRRYQKDFFHLFGTDSKAYIAFYDDNRDYFYSHGFYHFEIDEDVKSLQIPNNDQRLLDAAIKLWETGQDPAKARRILTRYTLLDFPAAEEWRAWYEGNKQRLFFTESGGWLFLVNSREPGVNDYRVRDARDAINAIQPGETSDREPVKTATALVTANNGDKELVVKIKIHPGYHLYANVAREDPFIPTTLDITLPPGHAPAGEMLSPSFKPFTSNGTTIYEDEIVFRQPLAGTGSGEATCTLKYQCCDAHVCMLPAEEKFVVKL